MTTPEQIEALLEPHKGTLKELPVPNEQDYAYESKDRIWAAQAAQKWQGSHYDFFYDAAAKSDFICHQSDVIELLVQALSIANRRLGY